MKNRHAMSSRPRAAALAFLAPAVIFFAALGAPGKNGGVIIPLVKSGDKWMVPANAKLTDAQYKAFQAGDLYVNVHSAAHKDGEIRTQVKP